MKATGVCLVILALLISTGCARGGSPVAGPVDAGDGLTSLSTSDSYSNNRILLGLWRVSISADRTDIRVAPDRATAMHLNCVRLLEVTPCHDCFKIENVQLLPDNVVQGDIVLQHPYKSGNLKLSGFDARVILIGEADYTWPVSGRKMAVGDDVPRMLNPDGYTSLFNPTEFPSTTPPALGYIVGKYTFGGDLTATLNPYVAFHKDEPRRVFRFGDSGTETVQVRLPDGPIEFGYAVDGCWQTFDGFCIDPVEDFPPDANCLEAYEVTTWAGPGLSLDPGAWTWVYGIIRDHQGGDTIARVTAEIPDVVSDEIELEYLQQRSDGAYIWRGRVENELGVGTGNYPFLLRVVDTEVDQNLGPIDAWSIGTLPVRKGWVMTWADRGDNTGATVCACTTSDAGDIYVMGSADNKADFDPGPAEAFLDDRGGLYLTKFDWAGGFEWIVAIEVGVSSMNKLTTDPDGNIYLVGRFSHHVDFDPGPGVEDRESWYNEETGLYTQNMYLLKLNSAGEFEWVDTWVTHSNVIPKGLATDDSSNIYITGFFDREPVDFDPGLDIDEHECRDDSSAFLIKLAPDGSFVWARDWGGEGEAFGKGVASDSTGCAVVSGNMRGIADMDPGPGEEMHGFEYSEIYLSKFDPEGEFLWCRSLTGSASQNDPIPTVCIDSADNIYLYGDYSLVVDFDPGPEMDTRVSNGSRDMFLTKYSPDGDYLWVRTWGGIYGDDAMSMTIGSDYIYVGGLFRDSVDFDPGPGTDEITAHDKDSFLSKFDSSGDYKWAATWACYLELLMTDDHAGNCYIISLPTIYGIEFDFDPGPTEEWGHTGLPFLIKMPYDFYWW